MSDPQGLRDKAAQCRRLARKPRKGFPQAGGHHYLLDLADRFDREAVALEQRMAGAKPGSAVTPVSGGPDKVSGTASPPGTTDPSRAS
jgi:hypothetical protein